MCARVVVAICGALIMVWSSSHAAPRAVTLAGAPSAAPPTLQVLFSSEKDLTLTLEVLSLEVEDVEADGRTFQVATIPGGGLAGRVGRAAIPTLTRMVSIPAGSGVKLRVTATVRDTLEGYDLLPMQPAAERPADTLVYDETYYAVDSFGDTPTVKVGEPAILRNLRVVPLTFAPVRYNPARRTLEVTRRATLHVEFDGEDRRNTKEHVHQLVPSSFDRLYRALVVNYDGPEDGQRVGNGSYVVICPDSAEVVEHLQPLLEWRERMGYPTVLATTADVGGSSAATIKDYLQDAYENWDIPPEYVCLVGDAADCDVLIPTFFDPSYGGEGDHPYTTLEGDDILSDIHIGRLSVYGVPNVWHVVHKITQYEMNPHFPAAGNPDWFRSACLIGDPLVSGITCVHVMQWIWQRLGQMGYVQIDEIYSEPFVSGFTNSLNNGVGIMAYRGFVHMSGIGNSQIWDLENGEMLPFAVCLTCDTGSFASGTSRSETFLRVGIPGSMKGAIGSIGTATYATETRYNNVMMFGILQGLLYEDLPELGADLTRGKLEMYLNFFDTEPTKAEAYAYWNNLMGDPATRCWTDVPASLAVGHPALIAVGSTSVRAAVTDADSGEPLPGACVCLWKDGETHVSGFTDDAGQIELPVSVTTPGLMRLTTTSRDCRPFLADIPVSEMSRHVAVNGYAIDDDSSGTSAGDGDGRAGAGEAIELPVELRNWGTLGAGEVTAVLRTDDAFATVTDSLEVYGDIPAGQTAWGNDDFDLGIDGGCPDGRVIPLRVAVYSGDEMWHSLIELPVVSVQFEYAGHEWHGAGGNGILDPGESAGVSVAVTNIGESGGVAVSGTLVSLSPHLVVEDPAAIYGAVGPGETATNTQDPFTVSAAATCFPGYVAACLLALEEAGGARDTVVVGLKIGSGSEHDPVGPDAYGYYAFDDTDSGYAYSPVYAWIEIDPTYGGDGSDAGLADFGFEEDDHVVLDLPFAFTYYGSTFTQVTVCSNGWMAMGACEINEGWNTTIPGAGGPNAMVAPFWDDLYQMAPGGVYVLHDQEHHRFVVEWSRLRNQYNHAPETFELILLDPAWETTPSGDGQILLQYHTVNNVDRVRAYATVGIEDPDHSGGLLYTYWNQYPDGAAPLAPGRAVRFAHLDDGERGSLAGQVVNLSAGGAPVQGARVRPLGSGCSLSTSAAGAYSGAVPVGMFSVAVDHPAFAPDTAHAISITGGDTAVVDFSLTDIAGPWVLDTTIHPITNDTIGPYEITTRIEDESGVAEMAFHCRVDSGPYQGLQLIPLGDARYRADIPGQDYASLVEYYVYARDGVGNERFDPPGAPADTAYGFFVVPGVVVFEDNMETPAGWTTGAPGDDATGGLWERVDPNATYAGTTMVQPEEDHTADPGVYGYITGQSAPGANQGANDVDNGRTTLLSPPLDLSPYRGAALGYYRWYTNDTGLNPGEDYWQVDVSGDGGSWVSLEHTNESDRSWCYQEFHLEDYIALTGQVQVRFVAMDAGSGSIVEAGVDDVRVLGLPPPEDHELPSVTVLDPNGGEQLVGGSATPYAIRWDAADDVGITATRILLSTDGGASFADTLAAGDFDSTFAWAVPDTDLAYCRIKVVCADGAGNEGSDASDGDFEIASVTSVGQTADGPPPRVLLEQNRPNPFHPATVIRFGLPSPMDISLKVFSVEGRLVAVLAEGVFGPGRHTVTWRGRGSGSAEIASGIYICRLETPEKVVTRKMLLLK